MRLPFRTLKTLLSLLLAFTVTSLFTLRAFAADEVKVPVNDPAAVQDCTGTLTIKSGKVSGFHEFTDTATFAEAYRG